MARGGNSILSSIASFVKPAWELAGHWQFWVIILGAIALVFCIFVLLPLVKWLLWWAGRIVGMMLGGG